MMPAATSRSRHSSAHVQAPQMTPKVSQNGSNEEWVEPPLEKAKASYEDHGGAAFGVLEDMLPLGHAPNAKVKSRVRADPASRKSALGKNAAGIASDAHDTPEMTPGLDPTAAAFDPSTLSAQPMIIFDDEKDQDYMPRKSKKTATKGRAPRISLARTVASSPANTPTPAPSTSASTSVAKPAPSEEPAQAPAAVSPVLAASSKKRAPRHSTPLRPASPQPEVIPSVPNLEQIVDAAVDRSREVNNPVLGLALRDLYKESLHNQRLMHLFGAVVNQEATEEETTEFRGHIGRAKKHIKDAEDSTRKSRKSSGRKRATVTSSSPLKPAPPPELIPRQSIEAPAALPRPKISIRVNPPKKSFVTLQSKPKQAHATSLPATKRARSVSSNSSMSSLTSMEEDVMEVDSDNSSRPPQLPPLKKSALSSSNGTSSVNGLSAAPSATGASLKRTSADAEMENREKELAAKKQKLSESIDRVDRSRPSFERTARIEAPKPPRANGNSTANGHVGHGQNNRTGSPDGGSPLTDISSTPPTRLGTPKANTATTKTSRPKAKTKQSPVKKQTANYGGELNGSGGRESPIGYDDNEESENNDFCASCHGSGFLLCCDGCDRSFHFACLDPPLSQDASELQEPWYCFKCVAKRAQPQKHQRGLFSALLTNLDKRNPSIFSLPQDVKDYYEGVATGKDGRFLEAVNGKTRSRTGYDELPDNYRMKDAKGQSIICFQCNKSSMGRREIITCDQCNANWHLDCLDPPLANAPYRDQWGKKVRDWLCPLHIDHELREIDISRLASRQLERDRKVYMRKPRNAKYIDTSLNRGFINDGVIEVINDESEDDEFYEEEVSGVVYRLPERGIKLDFIDHVHRTKNESQLVVQAQPEAPPPPPPPPSQLSQPGFAQRSFLEQQTALSLLQFSDQEKGLDLSSDQVETLLGTLIAEAPADVVAQMLEAEKEEKQATAKESDQQRKRLEMLQTLISRKLELLK